MAKLVFGRKLEHRDQRQRWETRDGGGRQRIDPEHRNQRLKLAHVVVPGWTDRRVDHREGTGRAAWLKHQKHRAGQRAGRGHREEPRQTVLMLQLAGRSQHQTQADRSRDVVDRDRVAAIGAPMVRPDADQERDRGADRKCQAVFAKRHAGLGIGHITQRQHGAADREKRQVFKANRERKTGQQASRGRDTTISDPTRRSRPQSAPSARSGRCDGRSGPGVNC